MIAFNIFMYLDVCMHVCISLVIVMLCKFEAKRCPWGWLQATWELLEGLSHWLITDLSTTVCEVNCLFNYFADSQKCCAVVLISAECFLTYVWSLCLLLITPEINLSALPLEVHL